jgi:asparagine N-glycosylation enzyme membrane subunit Stt3
MESPAGARNPTLHMDDVRSFQAAVTWRSLGLAVAAAPVLLAFGHAWGALAFMAGTLVGNLARFHTAAGFNRLTKSGRRYLPLLTISSMGRVILAGAGAAVVAGHRPPFDVFAYLAGFVAPLAVAIAVYRQQNNSNCADTGAAR